MILLSRLKKILQDNLSLSSKLFLKEQFSISKNVLSGVAGACASLAMRIANVGQRLGIDLPHTLTSKWKYSLEPPTLAEGDPLVSARLMALKKPENAETKIHTSIIIPVFNKAAFTVQCLHSLMQNVDLTGVEIIIVNNASTDETQQILLNLADLVRVINNQENKGFVDACNQGASIARGKYLVFLNNDTAVLQGWLAHLLDTIEANSSVGAVGSMFLYPDRLIQEAGALVWRNGEAHHYGWGHSPDDRRFNFLREVDYCSAASLLIRKEIFQELGGFDRRFAPAYYEDVDLCFGVRSLGYKVIYQPMSRLVHYEGITAGRDTIKGTKHLQIVNRTKFVEKWHEVLERDHLERKLNRLDDAAHRNFGGPAVVVFDERVPSPDRDAGSARMFTILQSLAKWSKVIFVPFYTANGDEYEQALWKEGIQTANAVDYRRLLKSENVQVAIVSRPSVAEALIPRIRRINKKVRIVFDTVDVHFVRLEREHQIGGDHEAAAQAQRYRKLETRLAASSDLIWCCSREDKRIIKSHTPDKTIDVIPTIHELHDCGKSFEERQDLLFIGNLGHRPNEDAVHFFMQQIYPLVRESLQAVKVLVVGDKPSAKIFAYNSEQVRIMGYVPDVEPLWQRARVFIAPVRFGAGIKGKVGEAMAHGLPLVTTSIGAEGFGLTNGVNALIEDDPQMFAGAVLKLYSQKELWQTLAKGSHRIIEKHFTPEITAEFIKTSIANVLSTPI